MSIGRAPQPGPASRTADVPAPPAQRWVGVALVATSAASFGTLAIFARIAYDAGGEPVAVLLARFVLAGAVLVALMVAGGHRWPRGRTLAGLVALGGIGYAGQSLTFFTALTLASAGLVSLLLYLFPAVVLGLSVLFLGERLTPAKVVALALAVTGSALTIGAAGGGRPLGIVLGVASALIYSGYILLSSRLTPAAGAVPATTVIICTAAVTYAGIAAVTRPAFPSGASGLLALLGLALVATVLAVITFFAGMARLGPSDTSTLSTLEPVVTLVLAAAVLGETVTAGQLTGGALILSAVLVLARPVVARATVAPLYLTPPMAGDRRVAARRTVTKGQVSGSGGTPAGGAPGWLRVSAVPTGRRRAVTAGERTKWAWAGVLLVVLLTLLDSASAVQSTFIGLTVVGPFLAAVGVGPVRTALVGGYTVLVAGILLVGDGLAVGSPAHSLRILALAAGCALAVWVAEQRVRREAALVRLQLVAEAAQRAILRAVPERTGAVAFAARYQSAAEESRIGGDMYEVADSPHGVRVLVGDVRGKGLEAVQLTSLVLGSFREAAYLYPELTAVAQGMADSTARNVGWEDFVTAVLLELRGDQLVVVNCGHLPPLLLPLHGEPGELSAPITTPLGLSPEPRARLLTWEVGDRVLLYTDGLAEARDRRGAFFPLATAVRLCGDRGKPLAACADELLTAVALHVGGRLNDDLAFVLLEREAA